MESGKTRLCSVQEAAAGASEPEFRVLAVWREEVPREISTTDCFPRNAGVDTRNNNGHRRTSSGTNPF